MRLDSAEDVAKLLHARRRLGLQSGTVIGVRAPLPPSERDTPPPPLYCLFRFLKRMHAVRFNQRCGSQERLQRARPHKP